MKLTEKQIAALEKQGAKRWTKGDYDRLYVNGWNLPGVTTNWKRNGNKTVTINGEELSYTKSAIFGTFGAKNFIDVKTGEVFTTCSDRFYSKFIIKTLRSMIPEDEPEQPEEAEQTEQTEQIEPASYDFVRQNESAATEEEWLEAEEKIISQLDCWRGEDYDDEENEYRGQVDICGYKKTVSFVTSAEIDDGCMKFGKVIFIKRIK